MFARSVELGAAPSSRCRARFLRTALACKGGSRAGGAMVKLYFGGALEFGLPPTATALDAYLELLEPSGFRGRWPCSVATSWAAGWRTCDLPRRTSGSAWRTMRGRRCRVTSSC